ncbi:hypothetical protein GLW20_02330 [Virgibacillus halodenitrificans]|nr:hypothetical protein [Virgibacillus halodenitrificans]
MLYFLHPSNPVTVTVDPTTATVAAGGTQQLTATVTNAIDTSVTWSSSDDLIATVDTNGLVTVDVGATSAETVTITATSVEDGTKTATATITVA